MPPSGIRPASTAGSGRSIAWLLLAGGLFRVYQYLAPGSLWSDELALVLSVTRRGWSDSLTTPLFNEQVAPIGFLVAEKIGASLLGATEAGLRLFPFLASVAGLLLSWRLARRYLDGVALVAAVSLVAFSPALLWYARNAKQYSGDVAVVLLLIVLAQRLRERPISARTAWGAGALGAAAILCSQPGGLVAIALLGLLIIECRARGKPMRPLAGVAVAWIAGVAALAWTSLLLAPDGTREFMYDSWEFAFFPPPWRDWWSFFWLPHRTLEFLGFSIGLFRPDSGPEIAVAGLFLALVAVGGARLWRRGAWDAAYLLAPILVALAASAIRLLPYGSRVSLHMAPSLLILAAAGANGLGERFPVRMRAVARVGVLLLGLAPAPVALLLLPFLNQRQPTRQVLEELRSRWEPGDSMYVFPAAGNAYEFYGPPLGLQGWVGELHGQGEFHRYIEDAERMRGRPRAWFFFTGSQYCEPGRIADHLDRIGTRKDRIDDPFGNVGAYEVTAYLYALDDSTQWSDPQSLPEPWPFPSPDSCGIPSQWRLLRERIAEGLGQIPAGS